MAIRVLVFDQNRDLERLAKKTLGILECEVITASTVALAVFLARKNLPAAILVQVAWEEGYELFREIKHDEDLRNIPLLAFANEDCANAKFVDIGAAQCLPLPISEAAFLFAVKPFLIERQTPRPEETPE